MYFISRSNKLENIMSKPKVYIASTLANWERVRRIRDKLIEAGIEITYDWTLHGAAFYSADGTLNTSTTKTEEELEQAAISESKGVIDAHAILAVMPGGRGTHFELGVAFILNTPAIILMDQENADRPTSFHYLPSTTRHMIEDEAIADCIKKATVEYHNIKERGYR
jgi:nucleoside 2-deoxyribosyltransferase